MRLGMEFALLITTVPPVRVGNRDDGGDPGTEKAGLMT
jgi:hypothetical protein